MQQTLSSTPLEAVLVAPRGDVTDVWLRRNIVHDYRDEPDGTSQEFWSADEVCGTMPAGTTAEQVKAEFDRLWLRFDSIGLTDREYAERTAKASMQAATSILGASEAPAFIAEGELFIADGRAYVALQGIARGERLIEHVNVQPTTITNYLMAIREMEQ